MLLHVYICDQYRHDNAGRDYNRKCPYRADRHQSISISGRHLFYRALIGVCTIEPDLAVIAEAGKAHQNRSRDIAGPAVFCHCPDNLCQNRNDDQRNHMPHDCIVYDKQQKKQSQKQADGRPRSLHSFKCTGDAPTDDFVVRGFARLVSLAGSTHTLCPLLRGSLL